MGIFDKLKSQARNKGKQGSDTAEQRINERTGGKYEDQVDSGQQRVEGSLGMDRDRGPNSSKASGTKAVRGDP